MWYLLDGKYPPPVVFEDSHITVRGVFKYQDVPVDVDNPQASLYKEGEAGSKEYYILRPIQKENPEVVGQYIMTFLTNGLSPGKYRVVFEGTFRGSPLTLEFYFDLVEKKREQWFIDSLRAALLDKYNLDIPRKYFLYPPEIQYWEDGELYAALCRAVSDLNETIPVTVNFTLNNVPITSLILLGGQLWALMSKGILERVNYFEISTDLRVSVYRGDKYTEFLNWIRDNYFKKLEEWKKDYVLRTTRYKLLILTRVPRLVLAPISMEPRFHSLYRIP